MSFGARVRLSVLVSLLLSSVAAFAHVTGNVGLAPILPPNTPGIDNPFPNDPEKFSFAVVGDKTGGGEKNWPIFDRVLDEISRLRPDFAIMVGDLIQGYTKDVEVIESQWAEFRDHAGRIEIPFFFLPGNHDISNKEMYDFWESNVGKTYYSFRYKNSHFILLNTEEGWRNGEETFGSEQLEWLRKDIEANRDAAHRFLFMHRPVWYHKGESYAQWEQIEEWLSGLSYTVFAGHFHRLSYEMRRNRPYYVLSASGAGLQPTEALEMGRFFHYTVVTVDGEDVYVAIVEPGKVHPSNIATREFQEKAGGIAKWTADVAIDGAAIRGVVRVTVENPFEKEVTLDIAFRTEEASGWKVEPSTASETVAPGEATEVLFTLTSDIEKALPLPTYSATIRYGGKEMFQQNGTAAPPTVPIETWNVVGPFDLGVQSPPKDGTCLPAFAEPLPPERDPDPTATYAKGDGAVEWREATTRRDGFLDLNGIYPGDFSIGIGLAYIYSPDARTVFADIQTDDLARVLVNGEPVVPSIGLSRRPTVFLMTLEPGWNAVLVKCADYTGDWGYRLRVQNPRGDLRFATRPE